MPNRRRLELSCVILLSMSAVVFTILGEAAFTRSQLPAGAKGRPPIVPTVGAAAAFAVVRTFAASIIASKRAYAFHVLVDT